MHSFYLPILLRSKIKRLFRPVIVAMLIAGLLILIVCGLKFIWSSFISGINKDLAVGIIAAGTTIAVSIISVLIAKHLEQQNVIRNEHREKKIPIYVELIEFLFGIWQQAKDKKATPTEKQINDFMLGFTKQLLVWGSDEVIIAFNEFRRPDHNAKSVMLAIEKIWFMIRKDLGHTNKGLVSGMLLNLFITDMDDFLSKNKNI